MNVLIVYYSQWGHVLALAEAVAEGVREVAGCEALLRRVSDFPEELERLEASEHGRVMLDRQKDIPIVTHDEMRQAGAIVFGTPTRFGNMTAQMKRLIDSLGGLWMKGELEGKPTGVFTSTATTHGGQETTIVSAMLTLFHLGMIVLGTPYSTPGMLHTEGRGGTPYGPSTVAGGDNSLKPKDEDLAIARSFGRRIAQVGLKLAG